MDKSGLVLLWIFKKKIKNIILELLNPDSTISIKETQQKFNDLYLETNLAFNHAKYGYLSDIIKKLEKQGFLLETSIEIVRKVYDKLSSVSGITGKLINDKFKRNF